MSISKKCVVCLPLLLTLLLAAGLLVRPCPALAVWGDNNEPLPVVLGLELGDDIRKHPDWERESPKSRPYPKDWDKEATYEGIPVKPIGYGTFDHKIAAIDFFIKVKDFPRFRKLMRRKFGNEILRSNKDYKYRIPYPGYYWGKYEVEVQAFYPFKVEDDMVHISFTYLPLDNQRYYDFREGFSGVLTYHGVTLGRKVEEYPFLHPIKEEAPDIVYYQSDERPLIFHYSDGPICVESETWLAYKGVIYSLELRGGDKSHSRFLSQELSELYKLDDYRASTIAFTPELRLRDYAIYFKPGLTITTYMPTYWAMLRAKTKLGK